MTGLFFASYQRNRFGVNEVAVLFPLTDKEKMAVTE